MIYGSCKMSDLEQKFGCESSSFFIRPVLIILRAGKRWREGEEKMDENKVIRRMSFHVFA